MGKKLPFKQKEIEFNGHVIQFRINAENPTHNFAPSPGTIWNIICRQEVLTCGSIAPAIPAIKSLPIMIR